MKYGTEPVSIGTYKITTLKEYMFYMYYPVKIPNSGFALEPRLMPFFNLISAVVRDIGDVEDRYIYLTVKNQFIPKGLSHNRPGWHSDGFGTDDYNYILYSNTPTEFCIQDYSITNDDTISLSEFELQSKVENIKTYPCYELLKLTAANIHRIGVKQDDGDRLFVKISVSKNKYCLKGNSRNYSLDYHWDLSDRKLERNVP